MKRVNGGKTVLLPFRENLLSREDEDNEFSKMNVILKLNNDQLLGLLNSYSSDNSKLRAVVKDGKIIGLKIINLNDNKKINIVKCNSVKENNGYLYHNIQKSNYSVNFGLLDYKLTLINYKPNISLNNKNLENILKLRNIVKIIEILIKNINNYKIIKNGIEVDLSQFENDILDNFNNDKEILKYTKLLVTKFEGKEIIEWKWLKFIRGFNNNKWIKRLFQDGYRRNDNFTMIYSGLIDPDMITEKKYDSNANNCNKSLSQSLSFTESESPKSPASKNSASSKSSFSSNTFSRNNSEGSGNTTPEKRDENNEVKKVKKSFKEYIAQARELNEINKSSNITSDTDTSTEQNNTQIKKRDNVEIGKDNSNERETKRIKKINSNNSSNSSSSNLNNIVKKYQNMYQNYLKLYKNLKNVEVSSNSKIDNINKDLKTLIDMHNELQDLRHLMQNTT